MRLKLEEIKNEQNRKYLKQFLDYTRSKGNSETRERDIYVRLKKVFNVFIPDKDLKKLTKKDSENLSLRLQKEYFNYWTFTSYQKVIIQLVKIINKLEVDDKLPERYRPLRQIPNKVTSKKELTRLLNKNIKPIEAIELVRKNSTCKRDSFIFMLLFDAGLRPHELLKGKRENITIEGDRYYYNVPSDTKTGSRKTRLILSTPFVQEYLETLPNEPETPLIDICLRRLELIIKRIGNNKITPYVLRRSGITYRASYLNDQELKATFGTTQFKHYIDIKVEQIDSSLDKAMGNTNVNGQDLKTLQPKLCSNCQRINDYDRLICKTCNRSLDVKEVIEREKKEKAIDVLKIILDDELNDLIQRKKEQYREQLISVF